MLITLQRESSVLYDVKVLYRFHQVTCAFSSAGLRTSFLTIFAPDMQLLLQSRGYRGAFSGPKMTKSPGCAVFVFRSQKSPRCALLSACGQGSGTLSITHMQVAASRPVSILEPIHGPSRCCKPSTGHLEVVWAKIAHLTEVRWVKTG